MTAHQFSDISFHWPSPIRAFFAVMTGDARSYGAIGEMICIFKQVTGKGKRE